MRGGGEMKRKPQDMTTGNLHFEFIRLSERLNNNCADPEAMKTVIDRMDEIARELDVRGEIDE